MHECLEIRPTHLERSQELLVNIIEVDQKVGIELMPIVNEDLGVELMSPDRGILNKLLNIRV